MSMSQTPPPRLILGSASPRRRELLAQIGVTPDLIQPADINEDVQAGELPRPYVQRVCTQKALALKATGAFEQDFVLCADTTVCVGRRILGKPNNADEAAAFLRLISGRRHRVLTACALMHPSNRKPVVKVSETAVKIARLHDDDIRNYLASDDWRGKAGGYGIQGPFAKHISWIQGTYASVMGLDIHQVDQLLRGNGWVAPSLQSNT